MASIGQIVFWSMIVLIIIIGGLIILILSLAFSGSQGFVEGSDRSPVGNLGQDVALECMFRPAAGASGRSDDVSITWKREGLSGVVYWYQRRAAELQDQNLQYKDRAQLFQDAIAGGNASLLLKRVRMRDEGVYSCSVSTPSSRGTVSVHLRVAAFSTPRFTRSNQTLTAEAQRWFPEPSVTWSDHDGNALNGSTEFYNNSAGILRVVSRLAPVRVDDTYTCEIQNLLVKAVSQATVTDTGVLERTDFTFNTASATLLPSHRFLTAALALCSYRFSL